MSVWSSFDYLQTFDDDHSGPSANHPTMVDLELDFDSKKTHLWDFFPDDDSDSSSYSSEETSMDAIRYPHGKPVTEQTAFASASLPVSVRSALVTIIMPSSFIRHLAFG